MTPLTSPDRLRSSISSITPIDSRRAASMNPQVLMITRSDGCESGTSTYPSWPSNPSIRSESTRFFEQPRLTKEIVGVFGMEPSGHSPGNAVRECNIQTSRSDRGRLARTLIIVLDRSVPGYSPEAGRSSRRNAWMVLGSEAAVSTGGLARAIAAAIVVRRRP